MPPKDRRTAFLGITNGEWLFSFVGCIAAAIIYGSDIQSAHAANVMARDNATKIVDLGAQIRQEIKDSEARQNKIIQQEMGVFRDDLREFRRLLFEKLSK